MGDEAHIGSLAHDPQIETERLALSFLLSGPALLFRLPVGVAPPAGGNQRRQNGQHHQQRAESVTHARHSSQVGMGLITSECHEHAGERQTAKGHSDS